MSSYQVQRTERTSWHFPDEFHRMPTPSLHQKDGNRCSNNISYKVTERTNGKVETTQTSSDRRVNTQRGVTTQWNVIQSYSRMKQ